MARQERNRSESGYYHIIHRGNERKNLFREDKDKIRFLEIIREKKQGNTFFLQAFCLMDNHIHLMLSEGREDISKVMKRITVSYVSYFNKKYDRVGHLFQDRFKSEVVEQDSYALSLVRYIHQNPVKAGMVKQPMDYLWSSYNCYMGNHRWFSDIVDTEMILKLFSENRKVALQEFEKFMNGDSLDKFLDFEEVMGIEEAKALFENMLIEQGLHKRNNNKEQIPNSLIKAFKAETNLSLREIANITGLKKDKINKILKS